MLLSLRKTCLSIALALVVSHANAMQPCREEGGCIDEASASVVAPIDVFQQRCSREDPAHETEYKNMVQAFLGKEDQHFLERLRASDVYAAVRLKVEAQYNQMDKEQMIQLCSAALQKAAW